MSTFRKAYTAAGATFVGALGTALLDGRLTVAEVLVAVGIGLGAGAAVYRVKNADAPRP